MILYKSKDDLTSCQVGDYFIGHNGLFCLLERPQEGSWAWGELNQDALARDLAMYHDAYTHQVRTCTSNMLDNPAAGHW